MKEKENFLVVYQGQEIKYGSSRQRKSAPKTSHSPVGASFKMRFYSVLFSLAVTSVSVALPLFSDLANSLQTQNLYTGLMTTKGIFPYSDVFAQAGILYYALVAFAYFLGSASFVLPFYLVANYLSGLYFYKLVLYLIPDARDKVGVLGFFYLLLATFGFGGLYASQLALPFILLAAWFLVKYFQDDIADEAFILFGMTGSVALLLEPRAVLFWLLAGFFVFVYNSKKKHLARGFYQFLCMIFGVSLIMYTVGYFVLNMQSLGAYIYQAGWLYFTNPARSNANFWQTLLFHIGVLVFSGFFVGAWRFVRLPKKEMTDNWFYSLAFFSLLTYTFYPLLSKDFVIFPYILALPFSLLLFLPNFITREKKSKHRHRVVKDRSVNFRGFLSLHYGLPVVLIAYAVIMPSFTFVNEMSITKEREQVATYLQTKLKKDDSIYVWDRTAKIYLETGARSSSLYLLPASAKSSQTQENELRDALLADKARYVVVNKNLALPESVSKNLGNNYKKVTDIELDKMEVYQLD